MHYQTSLHQCQADQQSNTLNIFTALSDNYMRYGENLIRSIMRFNLNVKIHVLNAGLNFDNTMWLIDRKCEIFESHFCFKKQPITAAAFVERPFINLMYPKIDNIIWLDADCWVQHKEFFNYAYYCLRYNKFCAAFENHEDYYSSPNYSKSKDWIVKSMFKDFGIYYAQNVLERAVINSGVIIASPSSPIWKAWQDAINYIIIKRGYYFGIDQTSLNFAVINNNFEFTPLMSTCNWMANLATPKFIDKKFYTPTNSQPIEVLHFAEKSKPLIHLTEPLNN
jgi:hypothetical protein